MLNVRILLLLALISAGIGYVVLQQFPGMLLEASFLGGFSFLALFSLMATRNASSLKRRISQLERGIVNLEASLDQRLNALSANSANRKDLETLGAQLANSQKRQNQVNSEILLNGNGSYGGSVSKDPSGLKKAVSAHVSANGKANGNGNGNGNGKNVSIDPETSIESVMSSDLCLHLQPIVDVSSRSTLGFQIVPALNGPSGKVSYMHFSDEIGKGDTLWSPYLDLKIFTKSLLLVRQLRQKAPDVKVFIPFSGLIFSDKRLLKQLKQEISANKALAQHCVVCIDASVWRGRGKLKSSSLIDMLDAGFGLALSQCTNPAMLEKNFKLSQFSYYFASVSDLGIDAMEQANNSAVLLQRLADEHDFKIVVSSVNHDYELIRLVDEDFPFAVGEYLSPAKAPNL